MPFRSAVVLGVAAVVALAAARSLSGPDAGAVHDSQPADDRPAGAAILDRRSADFREDEEDSRVVAALEATLSRKDGHTTLSIRTSALGTRVDPPRGFEGIRGANHIAAREIASILAKGRAEVRVAGPAGSTSSGRVIGGLRGGIPERRLLPDGRVEHAPAGGVEQIVEAVFEAGLPGEGSFAVEVLVEGHVRVRVGCRIDAVGGRIRHLRSVAEHETGGGT